MELNRFLNFEVLSLQPSLCSSVRSFSEVPNLLSNANWLLIGRSFIDIKTLPGARIERASERDAWASMVVFGKKMSRRQRENFRKTIDLKGNKIRKENITQDKPQWEDEVQ